MSQHETVWMQHVKWADAIQTDCDTVNIVRTADISDGIFKFVGSGKIRTVNFISFR
jgi:hypothetical protein